MTPMDYTTCALESLILLEDKYSTMLEDRLIMESEYMLECINSGFVENYVLEADEQSRMTKLIEAINVFYEHLLGAFRNKAVEYSKKYVPWIKDNEDAIKEKSKSLKDITAVPFWNVTNPVSEGNKLIQSINNAYGSSDYTDIGWSKQFVDNVKSLEDLKNSDLPGLLKNYFRVGDKNANSIKQVTMTGKELSSYVPKMIDYIVKYEQNIPSSIEKIKSAMERNLTKFQKTAAMDSFLYLENISVLNSELSILEGFDAIRSQLMEAIEDEPTPNKNVVDNKGKSVTSSITSAVTKDDTLKAAAKDDPAKQKELDKTSDDAAIKYCMALNRFFQIAVSAYATACEERFITYVNILKKINGGGPKLDKNGKYVKEEKKESTTKVDASTESSMYIAESYLPDTSTVYNKLTKGVSMFKL
jgi:hypothetical protein